MTTKMSLKKAAGIETKLRGAKSLVVNLQDDLHCLLRKALIFSRTVSEAMSIYRFYDADILSEKSMRFEAWKRAISLLRPSPKSFDDYLLITEVRYQVSNSDERLFFDELMAKRKHVLVGLSIEQLYQLYLRGEDTGNKCDNDVGFAKELLGSILRACNSLEQLEEWRETYADLREDRARRYRSFDSFWDNWQYEHAMKRVQPDNEAAEKAPPQRRFGPRDLNNF